MACTFEPDDEQFRGPEEPTGPAWVREAMGAVPVREAVERLSDPELEEVA